MNLYLYLVLLLGFLLPQSAFGQVCDPGKGDICNPAPAPPKRVCDPSNGDICASARYVGATFSAGNPKPNYPRTSQRLKEEGTVFLRVLVTADGKAGAVEIRKSSGFQRLDSAAVEAVKLWRFNPATIDGKAVENWYQIPITFQSSNEHSGAD